MGDTVSRLTDGAEAGPVRVSRQIAAPLVDPRLILLREPDSTRAAGFRVLRHRLTRGLDPRVVVVTSAGEGEGKTTCAANLAMAFSEGERARTLLVELNLRRPALAGLFGIAAPECFALQMARHREQPAAPWSVVEVSPSLHVAAVDPGPGAQEGRAPIDGPAVALALSSLSKAGYDYVVIDTPPVLGSADVNLIEEHSDGVILAVWAGRTSGRALARAIDQLRPATILGLLLLGA